MTTVVAVRSLTKHYRGMQRPAVDDVTFTIDESTMVGLLGPNGAGKTTLVKLLSGVTTPSGGRVEVLGGDPVTDAATVKQRLAVVHQSTPMDSMLPAIDNIKIAAALRGLRWRTVRPRVDEMAVQFGLEKSLGKLAFTLSGGQRRRLQLLRALLVVPRLLILDEPSAGLDVEGRRQMWDLLTTLNIEHGTSIIWTSHYLEEIERNCPRVLIVDRGALLRDAEAAALISEFGARAIRVRLSDAADRARLLALVPTEYVTFSAENTIDISGITDACLTAVVSLVRDAANRGATIEFREPSLEDAYLALVNQDHDSGTPR